MLSVLLSLVSIVTVSAQSSVSSFLREPDMALERESFEAVPLSENVIIQDDVVAEDIVVFDKSANGPLPPSILNISSVELVQTESAWKATYTFDASLPKQPSFPINVDLFLDSDGKSANNAKTGVFRAETDLAFLLLFGTRTKWHTLTWKYDPASGRWGQLMTPVEFSIGESEVTMTIPFSLLPKDIPRGATVRGFALTSTGGVTAVDVAPGLGLPDVLPVSVLADTDSSISVDIRLVVLGFLLILFAASVVLWLRSR